VNKVTWYSTELLYLCFFLGALTGLLILSAVARRIRRFVDSIPTAYAWNPNSHDKMTCYAIRLLQDEKKPTLMGWVFKEGLSSDESGLDLDFQYNIYDQVRRGSLEEDMNSNLWKSMLTKLSKYIVETKDAIKSQSYEGTNGAYHFYNPHDKSGLYSDTQLLIYLLWAQWANNKIPSAVERATDSRPDTEKWFLDNEERNYTEDDASQYFNSGYYHLSFYSIGRILHLLQDMAVPAHVRNSSHANMLDEPPDPLEYYADYMDSEIIARDRHKKDAIVRWTFDADVDYARFPGSPYERDRVYALANEKYLENKEIILNRLRKETGSITKINFHNLASFTKKTHYSFGTIPWNADSFDPERNYNPPTAKLIAPYKPRLTPLDGPDLEKKCRVNTDAFFDVLNLMIAEANEVIKFLQTINPSKYRLIIPIDRNKQTDIIDRMDTLSTTIDQINSFKPDFGRWDKFWTRNGKKWDALKPLIEDLRERWGYLDYEEQTTGLRNNLVFQRDLSKPKQLTNETLQKVIVDWVKAKAHLGNWELMKFYDRPPKYKFDPPLNIESRIAWIGFHGPYCLVNNSDVVKVEKGLDKDYKTNNHVVHDQYLKCQLLAINFCAVHISTWFEKLFFISSRGLGLWINNDAPDSSTPPEQGHRNRDIRNTIENEKDYFANGRTFTLGIINHLPVEIDLDISLTLDGLSEADKQEFLEGLPVKTIMRTDFGLQKEDNPTHTEHQSHLALVPEKELAIKKLEDVAPYTIEAIRSTKIPHGSTMGGIKRGDEDTVLLRVDDYVRPGLDVQPAAVAGAVMSAASGMSVVGDVVLNTTPIEWDRPAAVAGAVMSAASGMSVVGDVALNTTLIEPQPPTKENFRKPACIALRFEFGKDEDSSSGIAR